ncbi:MAG: 30S ribosomal protein S2 [Candidatus Orphnella occulta]|nr:30S ribosomal protein S2 [Candidatus Orphnella occulta]
MKQLLEAGVHFGHQTKRWNPKMAQFIFGQRNGIYIINLEKTAARLEEACDFLRDVASKGSSVLFVGTKKQAKDAVIEESQRCNMFSVTERWLGGLMTNFSTIRASVKRMKELEKMKEDGSVDVLTKKERAGLDKEWAKLHKNLAGVAEMQKLPGVVVIVDPKKEDTAAKEATKLNIPIVALIDTNSDPDAIDYPIPGNDDAIRAIKLVLSTLADGVLEGRKQFAEGKSEAKE